MAKHKNRPAAPVVEVAATTRPPLPAQAEDKHVTWFLNWLTDTFDQYGFPELTDRDAACKWAGVSQLDFGVLGALNVKAGITDPHRYVRTNEALNLLAYKTTNRDEITEWLSNLQALFKICREVDGG